MNIKDVLRALQTRLNPNKLNPLFGEEVAQKIRQYGGTVVGPNHAKPAALTVLAEKLKQSKSQQLRTLGDRIHLRHINEKDVEKFAPVTTGAGRHNILTVPDTLEAWQGFGPSVNRRNTSNIITKRESDLVNEIGGDKLREAQIFKGIGETKALGSLHPAENQKLTELLDQRFKDKSYVVKRRDGVNTISSRGTDDAKIFISGDKNLHHIDNIPSHQLDEWIAQPKKDLRDAPWLGRTIDKFTGGEGTGADEFRVHVLNGKVVPYATAHRGSYAQRMMDHLSPWRSKKNPRRGAVCTATVGYVEKSTCA